MFSSYINVFIPCARLLLIIMIEHMPIFMQFAWLSFGSEKSTFMDLSMNFAQLQGTSLSVMYHKVVRYF